MRDITEHEISKLQKNLYSIRKAGGWSAEEFGNLIGVTKQTISNLETEKTRMTKTQYIAIRTVLDSEIRDRSDNKKLLSVVNLSLNVEDLSETDIINAKAFIDGATKAKLDDSAFITGLAALLGVTIVEGIVRPIIGGPHEGLATEWLTKLLKGKASDK